MDFSKHLESTLKLEMETLIQRSPDALLGLETQGSTTDTILDGCIDNIELKIGSC